MSDNDTRIDMLERRSDIEANRLGVAEDLGWIIGLLSAAIVHLKWGGWLYPAIALFVIFYLVTYSYRKNVDEARDAFHKAAGIAKYRAPTEEP